MHLPQSEPLLISAEINTDLVKLCRKRSRAQLSQANSTSDDATVATVASKKRRVVKKSVAFSSTVQAIVIPTAAVSSPETWYVASQYTAFKSNMKRDVIYIASLCQQNKCHEMDRTEYCPLGLEKYFCSTADQPRSKHSKQQRIHAVLQQQAMQKAMFGGRVVDSETIRTIACALAKTVCDKAIVRAARLQQTLILH